MATKNSTSTNLITQIELRQLLESARATKLMHVTWGNIHERLLAGAMVEPGPLVPLIVTAPGKRWSTDAVAAVVGADQATALFDKVKETPVRYLRICINGQGPFGWKDLP